ncbi:YHYH protein [Granulosicoccaceae sp. 1_MG-2023]|nr:YHYH protein [Granulosicoccaceae sp. 1_MG-2023]
MIRKNASCLLWLGLVGCGVGLSACDSDSSDTETSVSDTGSDTSTDTSTDTDTDGTLSIDVDPTLFAEDALVSEPEIVDCTLSDGTETSCYQFVTAGAPPTHEVGPFCPESIYSTADEAGIWLDGSGEVWDVDGDFILNLPNLYDDDNWQLYDPVSGDVYVTDTQEACEAAARPDVDEAYQNYCVECSVDYIDGGVSETWLIPVTPVAADATGSLSAQIGLALTGIHMTASAPVEDILANYTIAAFDDCGGHVNPTEGYHYHAATGCSEVASSDDGHAGLIGYALDGYGIYGLLDADGNEPEGLDECRGQVDEVRGYHYHAAGAGENLFIGCFHGKTVEGVGETDVGGPEGLPTDGELPPDGVPPEGVPPEGAPPQ